MHTFRLKEEQKREGQVATQSGGDATNAKLAITTTTTTVR
jgi:hypothetical protein